MPERGKRVFSPLLQGFGALVILGSVGAVVWLKDIRTTKESPTAAISRLVGRSVSCSQVGVLPLTEGQSMVLLCTDTSGYRALWADLGDAVSDVTREVCAMSDRPATAARAC